MRSRMLAVAVLTAVLVGCVVPPPQSLRTASGNPEVNIPNVARRDVIDRLVSMKVEQGWQVRSASDFMVVVAQQADNMTAILLGTRRGMPEFRIVYTFAEIAQTVRVYARTSVVSAPGTGFEESTDTKRDHASIQYELQRLQSEVSR